MTYSDDDPEEAEGAIPRDAILLTDAYYCVLCLINDHPELLPKFDEEWSKALHESRELEKKNGHDPGVLDSELEEEWHRRREANLLLRLAIEDREFVPYVRDPQTGETLRLRSDGWIHKDWNEYIPAGIWHDYVDPDSFEAPGPNGSFIRGALRAVFFMKAEFEAWLKETFCAELTAALSAPDVNPKTIKYDKSGGKIAAVKEAVRAIYPDGLPSGLTEFRRFQEINVWLKTARQITASRSTIGRALKEMRVERN